MKTISLFTVNSSLAYKKAVKSNVDAIDKRLALFIKDGNSFNPANYNINVRTGNFYQSMGYCTFACLLGALIYKRPITEKEKKALQNSYTRHEDVIALRFGITVSEVKSIEAGFCGWKDEELYEAFYYEIGKKLKNRMIKRNLFSR